MSGGKRAFRYTFGLDDPFLGSLHVEQVAPLSSSFSSELDVLESPRMGKENYAIASPIQSSPYRKHLSDGPRRGRSLMSINANFFSSPRKPSHGCVLIEPSVLRPSQASPFQMKDQQRDDVIHGAEDRVHEDILFHQIKRPRISIEAGLLPTITTETCFQYGDEIVSDLLTSEREPATAPWPQQPTGPTLEPNARPFEWLDEGILQSEMLLPEGDPEDIIQFSSSFIDNFIEDIEKVFQGHEQPLILPLGSHNQSPQ